MTEPIKFNFSNANYFDFGNSAESLNMLTASKKFGQANVSLGLGTDTTFKLDSIKKGAHNNLAFEAKVKYSIDDNLNTQARFRKIGGAEQYRVTFGGSYNFDTKNSIYTSAHLTTKHSNGDWNTNTGAWVGYTHNFDKFSISAEVQQNIPFDRKLKSNDTMINVMATIPI